MSVGDIIEAVEPPQVRLALTGARGVAIIIRSLIALALVVFLVWYVIVRPRQEHKAAVQSGITAKAATSQVETGKDAAATGERVQIVHDRIEKVTHENTTRILAAPGASDAVPPAVDAAFVAALCMRDAYLNDPACVGVRQPPAAGGDRPDAGSAAPAG